MWGLWVYNWVEQLVYPAGAAALTLLLLPDGRLPSPRWRPLIAASIVFTALTVVLGAFSTTSLSGLNGAAHAPTLNNPLGIVWLNPSLAFLQVFWYGSTLVLLIAAASPLVKLRRSTGDGREQARWIAYAVVVSAFLEGAVTVAGALFPDNPFVGGTNPAVEYVALFGFGIALPVATFVAIMKYHLYDIDIIIGRTLVYGSLAVLITGVYVGIAVGIGELVGSGGKPNLGLSILATAIVAIGFQPARERLQRVANRLVYGRRATPYQVLSEFSSQVAGSYAADDVLPRMARVLEEGTGAERASVWLRSGATLHVAATWPATVGVEFEPALPLPDGTLPPIPGATRSVEVRHQGELLGALSVVKRRGESLTPVEAKLLDDLAHQAGLVLKNVGLTADLQRRLEELRASRQRLVSAQDEERRRLERNLHDGAQQHLVALKVKLGLAEMLAAKDPERAKATLQQLKADTDEALETLRDLARGIYPPLLAEKGLVTALESSHKATLPVTVEADGIDRYAQEIEATVYFCVLEALQNVQKYAHASRVVVRVRAREAAVHFEVEDDGRGFDTEHVHKGAGLTNMQDRLDATGGELRITSAAGRGTRVQGTIPIGDAVEASRQPAVTPTYEAARL
ncbi:MAG: sensor histidine kinase [Candidatus Dormibacteraeota bacterium]|nr:sensor histidine kinase [Candidatus Dormibacteraeota bacterium]